MADFFFVLSVLHICVRIVWGDLISIYYFPYLSRELGGFYRAFFVSYLFPTFFFQGGVRLCRWLGGITFVVLFFPLFFFSYVGG